MSDPSGSGSRSGAAVPPFDAAAWTAAFLRDALADGLIDRPTYDRLSRALAARSQSPAPASLEVPAMPATAPPRVQHVTIRPTKPAAVPVPRADVAAPRPAGPAAAPRPQPSAFAEWFTRVRAAIVSDVAVHGLAYLGVLLVFAGTLGFLLFSFGSLARPIRPWAELAVPTVLLGSAAFLRRRGAPMVANALGVVGGLLLPVVLFASYVDGEPFPPELHDDTLAVGVTLTSLVLAAAYALIARRWREASVRFLVAPMLWTACWGAAMLLPGGTNSLKDWTASQFGLFSVGVALTSVFVAVRPEHWLAVDARPSLLPGALLGLGVTLVLAAAEGWPSWPVVVATLASLVTTEARASRLPVAAVQLIQPALLWLALAALRGEVADDMLAPIVVTATIALLEWQAIRRPGLIPLIAAGVGAGAGLMVGVASYETATWGFVAAATEVSAWAHIRRLRPIASSERRETRGAVAAWITSIAAVAPLLAVGGIVALLPDADGYLVAGGIVVATALAVRLLFARDPFLPWCVASWSAVLAATTWIAVVAVAGPSDRALAGALSLAAVAFALTRIPVWVRLWTTPAIATVAGWSVAIDAGWTVAEAGLALAVVGALMATGAGWTSRPAVWHLSAAGYALGSVGAFEAAVPTIDEGTAIAVTALVIATLALTAADLLGTGRGPAALARAHTADADAVVALQLASPILSVVGLTATLFVWAEATGLLERDPDAVWMLTGGLGLLLAASTWGLRRWPLVMRVAADAGVVLASCAAVVAWQWDRASITTLSMAIAACALLVPEARRAVVSWIGWLTATALVARALGVSGATTRMAALVLSVWAGAIGIGALALDDALAGRREYGSFVRIRWLLAPAVIGLVLFPCALLVAIGGSDVRVASVACYGAAVIALAAWRLRAAALTVVSYLLVSLAADVVSPIPPDEEPWVLVMWSGVLLVSAWALEAPAGTRPLGARWDIPPFVVGVGALVLAVVVGHAIGAIALTWTLAGLLTLAMARRLRSAWVAAAGGALVFGGAYDAGHGWAAGVSLVASAVLAAAPSRMPAERTLAQLGLRALAAAFAVFGLVEVWFAVDGTTEELAAVMLALAGVGTLVAFWLQLRPERSDAATQVALVALGAQLVGTYAASSLWPERGTLVAAVLLAALEAAAAGLLLRRLGLVLLSPVLAIGAWFLGAGDLLEGDPMWWTIPVGLLFLVEAGITRAWSRTHEVDPSTASAHVPLEWIGMLTMLAAPLAQIITLAPSRGPIAIGIGLLLAVWGIATRVRRRLFVGAGAVVAAVLLMLIGPIAGLVRQASGAGIWVILALAGVVLIVVATSIERGRASLASALKRLDELLEGWE